MARSFSTFKAVSAVVSKEIQSVLNRRAFSAVSQEAAASRAAAAPATNVLGKKQLPEMEEKSPWVPDPVTGYYRPESHAHEIDVADLREALLKQKFRRN